MTGIDATESPSRERSMSNMSSGWRPAGLPACRIVVRHHLGVCHHRLRCPVPACRVERLPPERLQAPDGRLVRRNGTPPSETTFVEGLRIKLRSSGAFHVTPPAATKAFRRSSSCANPTDRKALLEAREMFVDRVGNVVSPMNREGHPPCLDWLMRWPCACV